MGYAVDHATKLAEILDILQKALDWIKVETVLAELEHRGYSSNATSVSALIRDLRKPKNGAYNIDGEYQLGTMVYMYRYRGKRELGPAPEEAGIKRKPLKKAQQDILCLLENRVVAMLVAPNESGFKMEVLHVISELKWGIPMKHKGKAPLA